MPPASAVAAFGEELRRAREARGVDLDTLCATTKVPARHIRALEEGAVAELPGGVFRRGFLRSYLRALGMDETPWLRRFEESCQASGLAETPSPEWTRFAENVRANRRTLGSRRRRKSVGAILAALLLLAGAWLAWRLLTHRPMVPMAWISTGVKSFVDKRASR